MQAHVSLPICQVYEGFLLNICQHGRACSKQHTFNAQLRYKMSIAAEYEAKQSADWDVLLARYLRRSRDITVTVVSVHRKCFFDITISIGYEYTSIIRGGQPIEMSGHTQFDSDAKARHILNGVHCCKQQSTRRTLRTEHNC